MLIRDMTLQESIDLLSRNRLGRLACAKEGQPYIVPIYFEYHADYLYSFTTMGKKVEWMRANPLVCIESDEKQGPGTWASVIASGRYEELRKAPEFEDVRTLAYQLFQRHPIWWEPGYVKTVLHGKERPLEPMCFRIHLHQITGHHATPDNAIPAAQPPRKSGWLRRTLAHLAD